MPQLLHMGHEPNHSSTGPKLVKRVHHFVEGVGIKHAEPLVNEQRVQQRPTGLGGHHIGKPERQRERSKKRLPAGQRLRGPTVAGVGVQHVQPQPTTSPVPPSNIRVHERKPPVTHLLQPSGSRNGDLLEPRGKHISPQRHLPSILPPPVHDVGQLGQLGVLRERGPQLRPGSPQPRGKLPNGNGPLPSQPRSRNSGIHVRTRDGKSVGNRPQLNPQPRIHPGQRRISQHLPKPGLFRAQLSQPPLKRSMIRPSSQKCGGSIVKPSRRNKVNYNGNLLNNPRPRHPKSPNGLGQPLKPIRDSDQMRPPTSHIPMLPTSISQPSLPLSHPLNDHRPLNPEPISLLLSNTALSEHPLTFALQNNNTFPQRPMLVSQLNSMLMRLNSSIQPSSDVVGAPPPKPILKHGKGLLGAGQLPSSPLPHKISPLLNSNGLPLIHSGNPRRLPPSRHRMVVGTTNRTGLPISKPSRQLGSHPSQPPLPNIQSGLPSSLMSVDGGLRLLSPPPHNLLSPRQLGSIPSQRGQLIPRRHQGGQLSNRPSSLSQPLPNPGKLRRQLDKPPTKLSNSLPGHGSPPSKLISILLVGLLQSRLIHEPTERPRLLPQSPGQRPRTIRPRHTPPSALEKPAGTTSQRTRPMGVTGRPVVPAGIAWQPAGLVRAVRQPEGPVGQRTVLAGATTPATSIRRCDVNVA